MIKFEKYYKKLLREKIDKAYRLFLKEQYLGIDIEEIKTLHDIYYYSNMTFLNTEEIERETVEILHDAMILYEAYLNRNIQE